MIWQSAEWNGTPWKEDDSNAQHQVQNGCGKRQIRSFTERACNDTSITPFWNANARSTKHGKRHELKDTSQNGKDWQNDPPDAKGDHALGKEGGEEQRKCSESKQASKDTTRFGNFKLGWKFNVSNLVVFVECVECVELRLSMAGRAALHVIKARAEESIWLR